MWSQMHADSSSVQSNQFLREKQLSTVSFSILVNFKGRVLNTKLRPLATRIIYTFERKKKHIFLNIKKNYLKNSSEHFIKRPVNMRTAVN